MLIDVFGQDGADAGGSDPVISEDEQSAPSSRKERAAEARRQLLDVAVGLFSDHSYDDVAVADIARGAGTAHGTLFHHFGSKRGIYLAALEEMAARQREHRHQNLASTPGATGLRRLIETHFQVIVEHPERFVRLMTAGVAVDPTSEEIVERDRWDAIAVIAQKLNLDSTSPAVRIALRGAIGGFDHSVLTWLALDRPFPFEDLIDALIAIIAGSIDGLAALDPSIDVGHARHILDDALDRAPQD